MLFFSIAYSFAGTFRVCNLQTCRDFFAAICVHTLSHYKFTKLSMLLSFYFFVAIMSKAFAFIHPITVNGRHFVDSETKEPVSKDH